VIETEPRPPVRAIVASFLFTDLVDFSKGAASEQYVAKAALAACLRSNLAPLREADYWIKDTGDGALIAFISNPEHALYMALAIAQDYAQAADGSETHAPRLRTGLHLGTVKETLDVEARRNYIGDGINATQRIMDFAAPGQIAASRNFFEAVANLDADYAALFRHLGASHDKHGRAHELYAVAPSPELLKKLRLDLTAAAPRPPTPGPGVVPAISTKRDAPVARSVDAQMPTNREPQAARRAFIPIVILAGVAILAATVFWIMRAPERSAATVEATKSQSDAVPASARKPDVQAATSAAPPAHTATSPALAPRAEATKPVETARVTKDAATGGTAPPAAAPAIAPTANVDSAPKTSAAAIQASRAPSANDRSGTRCSRIMEKATLGEPLSEEEKKELANSCR
jgi:class 3 adenylate cyclase